MPKECAAKARRKRRPTRARMAYLNACGGGAWPSTGGSVACILFSARTSSQREATAAARTKLFSL
eukprot:19335-Heterococcus_DN1.PRE.5